MPVIYLYVRGTSRYRAGGGASITVSEDTDYQLSKLFIKRIHKLDQPKVECIYVFKTGKDLKQYLTLTPNDKYSSAKLKCVHVYFNKHDGSNTPLLFVLFFQNGSDENGSALNKYYRMSNYTADATGCKPKSIQDLCDYTNEESILCALIQENDALTGLLTYDIMQRPNGNGKCTYNCNKIEVTDATKNSSPKLGAEFKVYKHQPKGNGDHKTKKACIVYNCQALLDSTGKAELGDVQNQTYTSVTVYFGQKAKRPCTQKGAGVKTCTKGECAGTPGQSSSCPPGQAGEGGVACPPASPEQTCPSPTTSDGTTDPQDVPLMIALHKQTSSGAGPEYYVHRRKAKNGETPGNGEDTYYWVKLENGNGELKQLLAEIGLETLSTGLATSSSVQAMIVPLLKRLEFDLTDSVVILLDKNKVSEGYNYTEIQEAIATLEPKAQTGNINPLKPSNGHNIQVTDDPNGTNNCLKKHKYRVVEHDFGKAVKELTSGCSVGLRFLIPRKENGGDGGGNGPKYAQLRLYPSNTQTEAQHLEYKYYQKGSNGEAKVYVVFYAGTGDGVGGDHDPRPLLLCYQNEVYRAANITGYDEQQWVKVTGVNKCFCNGQDGGDTDEQNKDLLKAVTGVVGFLNQVDLFQHPGTSTSKDAEGQQCPNSGVSGATCQTGSDDTTTATTCTYTVHRYNASDIKVQVKCEPIPSTPGSKTCYKKLTHQPAGINGTPNANFRLGDVAYCRNSGTARSGSIKYYPNGRASTHNGSNLSENNKYNPLVKVHAYFYDQDKGYNDPLLVVLEFKNGSTDTDKDCYRLKTADGNLEWEKYPAAKNLVSTEGPGLVAHLDSIRYCLKKVVKVELHRNGTKGSSYQLMGRKANGSPGQFNRQINNGQEVKVCQLLPCTALTLGNYKCFRHDLTTALKNHQHEVAGLAFTLPCTNGTGSPSVIEIPLYSGTAGQCTAGAASHQLVGKDVTCSTSLANGQSGSKITYNKCMGDVSVYFYHPANGGGVQPLTTDTVPLMLRYNGQFYKPETRDKYFDKWVCVKALTDVKGECCCSGQAGGHDDCQKLVTELDTVNLELNRIDLDPKKASGKGYGLPENGGGGHKLQDSVGNVRVKVVTQTPSGDGANAYLRVVHRTKNGFLIGEITYSGKDITSGITPKGENGLTNGDDTKIPIANGGKNHQAKVTENKWNTVAAYYSKTDTQHKLPQLIVILKTESPVDTSTAVTVSGDKYGYYVLATQTGVGVGGSGYEYKWRMVNGTDPPKTAVQLDDATDFTLLNAAVLLVEQRNTGTGGGSGGTYGEQDINKAIESAIGQNPGLASPGNSGGINRLKGKKITVKDDTDDPSARAHKCIKDYWFSAVGHDLTQLVELGKPLKEKLSGVTLITGLRFLIPNGDENKYSQVKLCPNGSGTNCSTEERHYYLSDKKIRVFFYGKDPRPLLLCCNGIAYKPKNRTVPMDVIQVWIEYDKWLKVPSIENCGCGPGATTPNTELLETLVEVVGFMNPVQLNPKQIPSDGRDKMTKDSQPTPDSPATATYKLHDFTHETTIKMKIKRETVNCYGKYTYEPGGTDGENGDGFRLGDVVYTDNKHTGDPQKLDYHKNGTKDNKWKPLIKAVVYYYNDDREYCEPLLVLLEFKKVRDSSNNYKEYYKLTSRERDKVEWQQEINEAQHLSKNEKLIEYLHRLRYYFKKVLKVEVWHNGTNSNEYPLVLSKRPGDSLTGFEQFESKTVEVKEDESCHALGKTGYKCLKHKLTSIGAEYLHQIGAVNFYTRGRDRGKDVELKLNNQYMTPLMYNRCMGDIYVYFYGDDPRPLLLCYDSCAYRATSMKEYDEQKWPKDSAVKKCDCTDPPADQNKLLEALVKVSDFLNTVKIDRVFNHTKTYNIHWFNGQAIGITVTYEPASDSFCYNRYTHKHYGTGSGGKGFRLGDIWYGRNCIKETQDGVNTGANGTCISASQGNNGDEKYGSFPLVIVFYYKHDTDHEIPIVVALCKNGSGAGVTCNLYYILKDREGKKYQQKSEKLTMDDDKKLGDELDKALFTNSKHLRVVLSTRPVPRDYKADQNSDCKAEPVENNGQDEGWYKQQVKKLAGFRSCNVKTLEHIAEKAKRDATRKPADVELLRGALMHHVLRETEYQAELLNGQPETPPVSPPPSTLSITVKEVKCDKSYTNAGYRCFRHLLVNSQGIEDVGGLKLAVFDGPGGQDLQLCTGNGTTDSQPVELSYTTCKGDLYVFFYGEDPRPLLLCYDNNAYRPMTMETYCREWVRVNDSGSGAATGSGQLEIPFRHVEQVLNALYQVSVFMNPVRLCLGEKAIEAMKAKRSDQDGQAQAGQPSQPPAPSPPKPAKQEWSYRIDQNPPKHIQVKVTPRDLSCYRVYTHQPEKQGFRLGRVTYAGADEGEGGASVPAGPPGPAGPSLTCSQGAAGPGAPAATTPYCFPYDSSKQLWSVCVYYYMYDIGHNWPLVVELGFRGGPSEFFRLCCKGSNGGQPGNGLPGQNGDCKAPQGLKWVRMAEKPGPAPQNIANSSCQDGTTSSQNGQGNDLCQPCNTGAGDSQTSQTDQDRKKMCQEDAEFVKEAARLESLAYGTQRPAVSPDFIANESDLNDLIERRAYEIRNQLGIEYTKEEKCLILATSSRCWEDSIMAYVVCLSMQKKRIKSTK